jgi:outer membrane protein
MPVVLIVLAGMPSAVSAQTLESALAAAYANNPGLGAVRASLRATDEQVPQALGNWRPEVEVSSDISRADTFNDTRTGKADQMRTPRGLELNVTQSLFRGFRTQAATREARNTVLAARARLLSTEQDVLLEAATAFMDVVRDQAVVEININNEKFLKRQLEAVNDRFEVGELTRTDVSQAEARLAGATAERIQAKGDLEASRAAYRKVIGEEPGTLVQPKSSGGLPASKEDAISRAIEYHPDVIAAAFDIRAAKDNMAEIRGELLPTVELSGTLSRKFESAGNSSRVDEKSIKATLTIPLYQQGVVNSRLRAARHTVGQQRLEEDEARLEVAAAATRAGGARATARARISSFTSQVAANEIALEGVTREAAVGARTVLDVLDAERELLDARVDLIGAGRDEVVAIFQLREAIGRLTARELYLPVDFYDPDVHYREIQGRGLGGGNEEIDAGK